MLTPTVCIDLLLALDQLVMNQQGEKRKLLPLMVHALPPPKMLALDLELVYYLWSSCCLRS